MVSYCLFFIFRIGNIFYTTLFISFIFSVLAFLILIFGLFLTTEWAIISALSLLFSKAFIDYSTSRLENLLSYFLLALFVITFRNQANEAKKDLFKIVLLFSLIYLNRPDLVLLVFPMLLVAYYRVKNIRLVITSSMLGALPLMGWFLFSLIYYGFPFPNTAYAKLGTGIDDYQLLVQGVRYFLDSIDRDPITLIVICFSVILGLKNRSQLNLALSLGIVLYLLYVLKIGGDFMSGRFLSVPFFAATILLVNQPRITTSTFAALFLLVILVGAASSHATIFSDSKYHSNEKGIGIVDERGFYYQKRGLLSGDRSRFMDLLEWPKKNTYKNTYSVGKKIKDVKTKCGSLGYNGLYSGPFVHFVDPCGLADPLLARLPARYDPNFRIGHFLRNIPRHYLNSIRESKNLLEDKMLKEFYDKLNIITKSSNLFSTERFLTILKMNLGWYSDLIDHELYGGKPAEQVAIQIKKLEQLNKVKQEGTKWNALGNIILKPNSKLVVDFINTSVENKWIDISLDHNDYYPRFAHFCNMLNFKMNIQQFSRIKHLLNI